METENNKAHLIGKVFTEPVLNHEVYGEGFYNFYISVRRRSRVEDIIRATISDRLMLGKIPGVGDLIEINGQYRSYNNCAAEGSRLILTLFTREITYPEDENAENINEIELAGYVCKRPVFRQTPFGREISDILLAVNRSYNKSDYIPCIAWGRNAAFSQMLCVGDKIKIDGRIQSREYQKRISEDEVITKTAFEVSIAKMEKVSTD